MAASFKEQKGFYRKGYNAKASIKNNIKNMIREAMITYFKWDLSALGDEFDIQGYEIEKMLFDNGAAVFFELGGDYFCEQFAKGGKLDSRGRLSKATPITYDGNVYPEVTIRKTYTVKNGEVTASEDPNAVLIMNNIDMTPTMTFLNPFIETLEYVWQTLQIQLSNSRIKRIITVNDDKQKGVVKREMEELIDGASSTAIVSSHTFTEGVGVLDAATPTSELKDIRDIYDWLFNWICTFIGVDTMAQSDKMSGMSSSEVESNKQLVKALLDSMLEFRQKACRDIEKLFGVHIEVHTKNEEEMDQEEEYDEELEGEEAEESEQGLREA